MAKFLIKNAKAKPKDFEVEKSTIGVSCLSLTIKLELISSGDFSKYIDENGVIDCHEIIFDIVSGKLKIGE